jgi:hypothetical protein
VIAETPHGFENLAEPTVVADVVADKVRPAHFLSLGWQLELRAHLTNSTIFHVFNSANARRLFSFPDIDPTVVPPAHRQSAAGLSRRAKSQRIWLPIRE